MKDAELKVSLRILPVLLVRSDVVKDRKAQGGLLLVNSAALFA